MSWTSGWKYTAFIVGSFATVGLAMYPIAIQPYLQPSKWQKIQEKSREEMGIAREERQPGGMKVWSDPFERK